MNPLRDVVAKPLLCVWDHLKSTGWLPRLLGGEETLLQLIETRGAVGTLRGGIGPQQVKIGGENSPRAEMAYADFLLKHQTIEMLEAITQLENGHVLTIEVKHGLPFSMEVEYRSRRDKWPPNA